MHRWFLTIFALLPLAASVAAGGLPPSLFFVANEGQWEEPFAFKAAVGNAIYYVTSSGITLDIRDYERTAFGSPPTSVGGQKGVSSLSGAREAHAAAMQTPAEQGFPTLPESGVVRGHVLRFTFLNANPSPEIIGEDKLSSYSNYFLGRDSCKWRSFVGHYQTVRMKNVWPGIDVVQKVQPEGIETLYRVQAGADAQQIAVQVEGLTAPLRVDGAGNLILSTSLSEVKEKAPFAYQIIDHRQVEVPVQFHPIANDKYSLAFEAFDTRQELVIDPMVFSTYFGAAGGGTDIFDVAIDASGNKIVCGTTSVPHFPAPPGAYQDSLRGRANIYVSKMTPNGRSVLFFTYMSGNASARRVMPDRNGAIYVAGNSTTANFPLTANAFDTTFGGEYEAFVSRFSSSGSTLEFSSYIGGSGNEGIYGIAEDSSGLIYLTGETTSPDFPVTPDALFPNYVYLGDPFVAIFNPVSSTLRYATFYPGGTSSWSQGIILDAPWRVWIYGVCEHGGIPITPDALQPDFQGQYNGFFSLLDLAEGQIVY